MGDIFREIDEDLRTERYARLWRRYGKYVIGAAVAIVVVFGAWKAWDGYRTAQRVEQGERFAVAARLLQDGRASEAMDVFSALAAQSDSGYGILSRFYQASIRAKGGDRVGAIELYDAIAAGGSVPDSMRELATVLAGLQALNVPAIDNAAIEAKIQPLARAGSPYRHIAFEVLALAALRAENPEQAKTHYRAIVDDAAAPPGIRGRASQMLNILGPS